MVTENEVIYRRLRQDAARLYGDGWETLSLERQAQWVNRLAANVARESLQGTVERAEALAVLLTQVAGQEGLSPLVRDKARQADKALAQFIQAVLAGVVS